MILHCVFCGFSPDADPARIQETFDGLKTLTDTLDGALSFDAGPNRDFEAKSPGFSHGFTIRFQTRAALHHYADHPTHKSLGQALCDLCPNGADDIMVYDLDLA